MGDFISLLHLLLYYLSHKIDKTKTGKIVCLRLLRQTYFFK